VLRGPDGAFRLANWVAFYAYALFLVLAGGLAGLFVPEWGPLDFEVYARVVFRLDLPAQDMASVLNQYRFMKSTEFGFGLFALLFRREIYTSRKFNRFFLGILFLGAAIRALSLAVDGTPHPAYIFFIGLEATIGLVILAYSRRTLAEAEHSHDVAKL
jgi:Domain of unknown function (DUF4345)